MIFDTATINLETDESYKERNLYYKIFAGYLFNELIPEYYERKTKFLKLLELKINLAERFFGDKQKADNILAGIQKIAFCM